MAIPYRMQPFDRTSFRMPPIDGRKNVRCYNQFHRCPDCNKHLWFSPTEDIFYCKTRGCYFVAETEEMKAMAQPKIDAWNKRADESHKAYEILEKREEQERKRIEAARKRAAAAAGMEARKALDAVVYYIEFGTRIKIGTTVNIGSRMEALPWDRILLMEPGSYKLEKQRHEQFADQHVTLEWFENGGPLLDHIAVRREELAEFNLARFPEQGMFPWVHGEVKTMALRSGKQGAITDPRWIDIPRALPISQASC